MSAGELAIEGGTPVRERPFPERDPFGPADLQQLREVIDQQTAFFPTGKKVYEFERRFRELYGVSHAVASTSGTSAIHVALGAVNPEPGQEVITTPVSDMGTVAPIVLCNAVPIFADVEPGTFNLDPDDVERRITDRTRAIIAVHCWGQPARMDRIMAIAREHDLAVIEDCSQSHLTRYRGRLTGTIGDLGAFSLQSSKHLQCGDGGVTITDDEELGRRASVYVDKGCDWTEDRQYRLRYAFMAPCYRMTELQGAVLCSQLERLEWIVSTRQRLGDALVEMLQDIPGVHPPERIEGAEHSYWHFPIRVESEVLGVSRKEFAEAVQVEGVPLGGNWIGKPLYMFEALAERIAYGTSDYPWDIGREEPVEYHEGLCPNAELAMSQLCVLAFNERWSDRDIADCAEAIRKVAEVYAARA
ncbi:MAG: DegT/DnrJ/EryC1/StrS family aminotransferase [Armatimonadota bacterium]